ncbi:hypothetical protein [Mycobacterium sp. IEC1808]|uniref:Pepco domain-containing protein n=1 Tax=Mycobacterium sp. IEC1808 TaxID=1743230 RepID=UPI001151D4FC|nr:hypothetical protein [Mycobacterium sp. IEC1808]
MSSKTTPEKIGMIPALLVDEVPRSAATEPEPHHLSGPFSDGDDESFTPSDDEVWVLPFSGPFRKTAKVVAKVSEVDGDELKKSLDNITTQLEKVLAGQTPKSETGFRIEEFKVGLGVKGKGTVYFVGELGVEASIELTFRRQGQ